MEAKMNIRNVYKAVQGRGILIGKPCIHVEFGKGQIFTPEQIAMKVSEQRGSYVCLCGDEPLKDMEEMGALLEALKKRGKFVTLETNGTIYTDLKFDFITICPEPLKPYDKELMNYFLSLSIKVQVIFKVGERALDTLHWCEGFVKDFTVVRKKKVPLLFYPEPNEVKAFKAVSVILFNTHWLKAYNHRVMLDISRLP